MTQTQDSQRCRFVSSPLSPCMSGPYSSVSVLYISTSALPQHCMQLRHNSSPQVTASGTCMLMLQSRHCVGSVRPAVLLVLLLLIALLLLLLLLSVQVARCGAAAGCSAAWAARLRQTST